MHHPGFKKWQNLVWLLQNYMINFVVIQKKKYAFLVTGIGVHACIFIAGLE